MVWLNDVSGPEIPQFYAGRAIFITGASGFMGKVLVERLLSTCPAVERLFLLIRKKKGVAASERLQNIKESAIFENLRQKNPGQLNKLTLVTGDITLPRLGIEPDDLALMKNVSIVFHSAATVKFDEPLKVAVSQNLRPVISIMELCDSLPNIQALVYVSTAYSNSDLSVVEEKVYPPHTPLQQLLTLTDTLSDDLLADITPKYISPKPNTYTYTKAMAEVAVEEHGCDKYPIAIFRPTIVVSALRDPMPGWVEAASGACGVLLAAGKGVLHVLQCQQELRADLLPVDIAIDTLIAVAWETGTARRKSVSVYNCSTGSNPYRWRGFSDDMRRNLQRHPFDRPLWYPSGFCVHNKFVFNLFSFLLHTMPLHLLEHSLNLLGVKPSISYIGISGRLHTMNTVLSFFMNHEWTFRTDNVDRLRAGLAPADTAIYNLDPMTIRWEAHAENFVLGTRRYLLKERDEDIPAAHQHLRKMRWLHYGMITLIVLLLFRLALYNSYVKDLVYGLVRGLYAVCSTVAVKIAQ